jgi:competence protein ComEC
MPPLPFSHLAVAAALLAGIVAAQALPALPPPAAAVAVALVAAALAWRVPRARVVAVFVFGFAYACVRGELVRDARLPAALEGADVTLVGQVVDLPRTRPGSVRFDLRPERARHGDAVVPLRGVVRLGVYGGAFEPRPGERVTVVARLKRPHGTQNPGGFDFERHAAERRIVATGYVRALVARERAPAFAIDTARGRISAWIARTVDAPGLAALLRALAVGDQGALAEAQWAVLRATGIAHLIAISGFHVGLVAGFGALLVRGAYRVVPRLGLRRPRRQLEAAAALAAALAYGALAGLSLPVVRTLVMIAVILAAVIARRVLAPGAGLALALLAVLLFDPLAVLGAGFWLSFVGVAWLVYCLGGRLGPARLVHEFGRAQVAMAFGLLPLTVFFFQQSSVVGPLANLVAVPVVSLVVVPSLLAATALAGLGLAGAGAALLGASAWVMGALWRLLEQLATWPGAELYLPEPTTPALAAALVGAAVLLAPRALPGRAAGLVLLLPLLVPRVDRPAPGTFALHVLDVGQGLAVLVRTREHALLYDAGAALPGGFDLGQAAVVPALRALDVRRLDRLVVSHGDMDHAGGVGAVARAYAPRTLSSARRFPERCAAGARWTWDGVTFEFLHPPAGFPDVDNDSSCVLRVEGAFGAALLPGDVSAVIEQRLVHADARLAADVLVVPHHGSRSSSSDAFLDAVGPAVALVSAGHRNRFGHPAPDVVARYVRRGVALHGTAERGMLTVHVGERGPTVRGYRQERSRWWREP